MIYKLDLNFWVDVAQIISSLAAATAVFIAFFQLIKKNKELINMARVLSRQVGISQSQLGAIMASKPPKFTVGLIHHTENQHVLILQNIGGDTEIVAVRLVRVEGTPIDFTEAATYNVTYLASRSNLLLKDFYKFGDTVEVRWDKKKKLLFELQIKMRDEYGGNTYLQKIEINIVDSSVICLVPTRAEYY